MSKKIRELQEALDRREQELIEKGLKIEELSAKNLDYQRRESEIVEVLTEAQATAKRILTEAEAKRDGMITEAEERVAEHERSMKTKQLEAQKQADGIVDDAKQEAKRLLAQADASLAEYKSSADKLKAEMAEAALQAQKQAERFKDFLGGVQLVSTDGAEYKNEYTGIADAVEANKAGLPESYDDPSQLMRSIYAIQGRELPDAAQNPAAEKDENEKPKEEISQTAENQTDGFESEAPDGHVWTVDEVINAKGDTAQPAADDLGADIDLDELIDGMIGKD